jgi:hypothetical protein
MRRSGFPLVTVLSAILSVPTYPQALIVRPDERVELLSIVFHLAGADVYNQAQVPSYARDVDSAFAPFRDQPVVRHAGALEDSLGIGFSDPMEYAIHLSDARSPREVVPFDQNATWHWPAPSARAFLVDLQAFVRQTPTGRFLSTHAALYDTAARRLRRLADTTVDPAWFAHFFGHAPANAFILVPALLNGGANYGLHVRGADGEQFYAMLGAERTDSAGWPAFNRQDVPYIIHEFCHSFSNPVFDRHRALFAEAGPRVLDAVRERMHEQAYDEWQTIVYESLVRVSVARYRLDHEGPAAARAQIAEERANSFLWMPELYDLMGTYEANRDRYPTLDAFAPRIAEYWRALPAHLPALMAQYDSDRPHLVSSTPANGATDVDASVTALTLRFDRPMRDAMYVRRDVTDSSATFPVLRGEATYDSTRTVLTIPVHLEPGTTYALAFGKRGFASAEGVTLPRTVLRFYVKPTPSR